MKNLDLRFRVRRPDGGVSFIWRAWSWRNDVYLALRSMARIEKMSFHESGVCRSAFTRTFANSRGSPRTRSNRVTAHWRRPATPARGTERGAPVAVITIPSDSLGKSVEPSPKSYKLIQWIDAAPKGYATELMCMFTRETEERVLEVFAASGDRDLVSFTTLPNGEAFLICRSESPYRSEYFQIPGNKDVPDLIFTTRDLPRRGEPVRFLGGPPPKDGEPIRLWELGGAKLPR